MANLLRGRRALILFGALLAASVASNIVLAVILANGDSGSSDASSATIATAKVVLFPPQSAKPDGKYSAVLTTAKGEITIDLLNALAPRAVDNFIYLAKNGFYNGLTFHRVQANFIVQGGDPLANGTGGPGYFLVEQANDRKNAKGTVSMAKLGGTIVYGSQFFINLADNTSLDADSSSEKRSNPFGEIVKGMDVAAKLTTGDVIQSVRIVER